MKKTEYFMYQIAHNQWQQGLNKVKELRDNFIDNSSIEKIVDEDLDVTFIAAGNQINFVIKLTYY